MVVDVALQFNPKRDNDVRERDRNDDSNSDTRSSIREDTQRTRKTENKKRGSQGLATVAMAAI